MRIKFTVALILAFLVTTHCTKREWDNPFDGKATMNPEDWAPQDFTIEDVSITEKKLTWTYNGDDRFEGFKIDRKKGDEPWQTPFKTFSKETRSWNDDDIVPDSNIIYGYRIYAFAGNHNSTQSFLNSQVQIPAPSNLQITPNSITSVTVSWQDNSNGEDGFRLERKQEGCDWDLLTKLSNTTYKDTTYNLNTLVYYRVSAYSGSFLSAYVENSFDAIIPLPENLIITINSETSITLNWSYNLIGHEGFKIDRKLNNGDWEVEFAVLNSNQTSFTENGLNLLNNTYSYSVYAFVQNSNSHSVVVVYAPCGDPFADSRDGNQYETIGIGTQCWMKENLKLLPDVSPSSNGSYTLAYHYVYGYQGTSVSEAKGTSNYQTYGVLYNWTAAMTACPDGWHLPSDSEWDVLIDYLNGSSVAGGKMKTTGTTHWNFPNLGATNESGFSGLPGGYISIESNFSSMGDFGTWWSSTEASSTNTWLRNLYYFQADVNRGSGMKERGFSVRCLRD